MGHLFSGVGFENGGERWWRVRIRSGKRVRLHGFTREDGPTMARCRGRGRIDVRKAIETEAPPPMQIYVPSFPVQKPPYGPGG